MVAKLKESGVEYRVSDDGSTVLAPSSRQAELRLELASAGLPKTGRIGFELFDKTNLGMTDFAEQVNYRRALEGELERSMRSISQIEQARVHITFPKDSVFLESRTTGKASVLLKLRNGAKLSPQQVTGISHMVASAVDGLSAEAVSVMDMHGTLLHRPKNAQDDSDLSDEAIEYKRRVERDLLTKINATLEPLLGPERFRAGVSVECDFTSGEQSEETYDPEKSVMSSSQKTEESTTGTAGGRSPRHCIRSAPSDRHELPVRARRCHGGVRPLRSRQVRQFAASSCRKAQLVAYPHPFSWIRRCIGKDREANSVEWSHLRPRKQCERFAYWSPEPSVCSPTAEINLWSRACRSNRHCRRLRHHRVNRLQRSPDCPGRTLTHVSPRALPEDVLVLIVGAFILRKRAQKRKAKAKAAATAALPPGVGCG